jgi:flagellar basal-body rod protein FlgF
MQNSLYVALSGQVSVQRRLETIANNVANMNTAGFRADAVRFEEQVAKAGDNNLSFVTSGAEYVSRRPGPLTRTNNRLDVAIQGEGWFAINQGGQTVYTRDGRFQLSENGSLQNVNGAQVLDAGGAPIQLNPDGGEPAISGDGMITQGGRQTGAIGLFALDSAANLSRAGSSGFTSDIPGTAVLDFTTNGVVQGAVEGSNVNPIEEMTKLIAVTRNFDQVANEVNKSESSVEDAIKALGSSA